MQSFQMRLDLWNAEITGLLRTNKGSLRFRSFTHADQVVQVIELQPDESERTCGFEWVAGQAIDPRILKRRATATARMSIRRPPNHSPSGLHLCLQPLNTGGAQAPPGAKRPR